MGASTVDRREPFLFVDKKRNGSRLPQQEPFPSVTSAAAAVFIFFSAAAWARLVSAYFFLFLRLFSGGKMTRKL